jgi:hypothetical protein
MGSMSGTRTISTTSISELSSSFFFLQSKAPKEIHPILTETLACFLYGRVKDLSASLVTIYVRFTKLLKILHSIFCLFMTTYVQFTFLNLKSRNMTQCNLALCYSYPFPISLRFLDQDVPLSINYRTLSLLDRASS